MAAGAASWIGAPDPNGSEGAPAFGVPGSQQWAEVPERVLARYRPHGRRLFWPVLLLVVVAAAGGYFLGRFPVEWQNQLALAVAVVLAVLGGILPFVGWLSTRYVVTTRRVIVSRGLVVRDRHEVSLRRGFDVTVRRRGLQALVRSGEVRVHSGSEHPLVLVDVPDARLIASALTELGERAALEQSSGRI